MSSLCPVAAAAAARAPQYVAISEKRLQDAFGKFQRMTRAKVCWDTCERLAQQLQDHVDPAAVALLKTSAQARKKGFVVLIDKHELDYVLEDCKANEEKILAVLQTCPLFVPSTYAFAFAMLLFDRNLEGHVILADVSLPEPQIYACKVAEALREGTKLKKLVQKTRALARRHRGGGPLAALKASVLFGDQEVQWPEMSDDDNEDAADLEEALLNQLSQHNLTLYRCAGALMRMLLKLLHGVYINVIKASFLHTYPWPNGAN